ncbi:MAG: hypothetical protein GX862_01595 [Leucobacter sp.]|nr:hypothetical protein [Leucobacter sp.]
MARVEVFADRVVIKLSAAERALALRSRDIVLSREAITSALITGDPWVWLRGVRSPGTMLPTKMALGTWRGIGGKDFALIRSGRPAIVLDFDVDQEEAEDEGWVSEYDRFSRVILSTAHAAELITALRLEGETAVFNTAE